MCYFNRDFIISWNDESIVGLDHEEIPEIMSAIIMLNYLTFSTERIIRKPDFCSLKELPNVAGIFIEKISENYAKCSMELQKFHYNAGVFFNGGAIFTLGDFAFAVAENCRKEKTVSLNNNITFLKITEGSRLTAKAVMISKTFRTCYYDVAFEDDHGMMIAKMMVTGYIIHK
jgi:acyl-CoA thioesterase